MNSTLPCRPSNVLETPALFLFLLAANFLAHHQALGQLSPPGLDGAKVVDWTAIGFSQKLSPKWSTTVYVGGSEQSNPHSFSPFQKPAILVINQETSFQFHKKWQAALCTSMRYQDLYEEDAPYKPRDPSWRKEIRYYVRIFYKPSTRVTSWTFSFRPEYRTFYAPNGNEWSTPVQLRFRWKGQAAIPINKSRTNFVVTANEWLFATEHPQARGWTSLEFTEDRLSTFFRHAVKKPNVFVDFGFMHQFWLDDTSKVNYTLYLSFDLLFQNPFGS